MLRIIQSDQKVSVHLTTTVQLSGAQRLFDHPVLSSVACLTAQYFSELSHK